MTDKPPSNVFDIRSRSIFEQIQDAIGPVFEKFAGTLEAKDEVMKALTVSAILGFIEGRYPALFDNYLKARKDLITK